MLFAINPMSTARHPDGPAVILVGGAFTDRSENAPLATELATHFTVYDYDRRGRGESGDTQPYTMAREFEDLTALVAEAGGSAHLYGISSGGALVAVGRSRRCASRPGRGVRGALRRFRQIPAIQRAYVEQLDALLAEGRRGDAAALFMRHAGATEEMIESARNAPMWPGLEALAPPGL